jgi:DNA primase small subunit
MLERVKEEVVRLIDEFLLGDLGFEEEELKIVFSGGRGYHVHINSPRVIKLTSHERREIVDYVTGTDLDMDWIFPMSPFESSRFKDRVGVLYRRAMPKQEDGGWRRRIRTGIDDLLTELEALAPAEAQARLVDMVADSRMDIGKKTIEGLYKDLFVGEKRKRGADRMRSEDNFEVFSEKRHGDAFIELVEMRVKGRMKGETDEPVTSDIKRLIRLPSSLHGKTGFEVVPMSREKLNTFNPFADAVSRSFGEAGVDVHCEKPVEVTLKERRFLLGEGKNDVPEYLAVYLVCRKLARIES